MPETGIGLFPDVGATWALTRLKAGAHVGLMLGLTGAVAELVRQVGHDGHWWALFIIRCFCLAV